MKYFTPFLLVVISCSFLLPIGNIANANKMSVNESLVPLSKCLVKVKLLNIATKNRLINGVSLSDHDLNKYMREECKEIIGITIYVLKTNSKNSDAVVFNTIESLIDSIVTENEFTDILINLYKNN